MIETKTKVIDGLTFSSTQLPPLKAYPLAARVGGILLPIFAKFSVSDLKLDDIDKFLSEDATKIVPILEPLFESLAKKDNEDLPVKLLAGTTVQLPDENGELSVLSLISVEAINRAFQGRGLTMFKAMWFSVEVNFRDFFGGGSKTSQIKVSAKAESLSVS